MTWVAESNHEFTSTTRVPVDSDEKWSFDTVKTEFNILSFATPFVSVRRKRDGKLGTLQCDLQQQVYFGFQEQG